MDYRKFGKKAPTTSGGAQAGTVKKKPVVFEIPKSTFNIGNLLDEKAKGFDELFGKHDKVVPKPSTTNLKNNSKSSSLPLPSKSASVSSRIASVKKEPVSQSSKAYVHSKRLYEEFTQSDYTEIKRTKTDDDDSTISKTKNWSSKNSSKNERSRATYGKIKMFAQPSASSSKSALPGTSKTNVLIEEDLVPINLELGKLYAPRKKHLKNMFESMKHYLKNGHDTKKDIIKAAKDVEFKVYEESSKSISSYHSRIASKMVFIRKSESLKEFFKAIEPPKVLTAFEKLSIPFQVLVMKELLPTEETLYDYGFWFKTHEDDDKIFIAKKDKDPICMTADVVELTPSSMVKCCRCNQLFKHENQNSQCRFHDGSKQFKLKADKTYSCCNEPLTSSGCTLEDWHIFTGNEFRHVRTGFLWTPEVDLSDSSELSAYAIDCEMIFTTRGHELARVTLIDFNGKLVFDWFIRPLGDVVDYVTKWSGITEDIFISKPQHSFDEVRNELLKYISADTFLIGHGLDSDLKVLKLCHRRILDTTILYPHRLGHPYKKRLKILVQEYLFKAIQEDDAIGHDSLEDSVSALQLVKLKLNDLASKVKVK